MDCILNYVMIRYLQTTYARADPARTEGLVNLEGLLTSANVRLITQKRIVKVNTILLPIPSYTYISM